MRTAASIKARLPDQDHCITDELEDQELDSKQWDLKIRGNAVKTMVLMLVCMANGGGGIVVFGDCIQG